MSTLVKITITSILSLVLFSCNLGIRGNGKVVTESRDVGSSFQSIEVSRGLEVYLTQDDTESIQVQADKNLQPLIITKIENNTLKIYAEKNIGFSESKKVMVSFKNLTKISTASGSDVYAAHTITSDKLELAAASGSNIKLDLNCGELKCKASSGSDMKLTGTTKNLIAKASSGSDINAKHLISMNANATAASGAAIKVNASTEFIAKTSSGGDVTNIGNTEKKTSSDSVLSSENEE